MKRNEYPNAAFAVVNEDEGLRLLLHHDPETVHDGREHTSVDPLLLMYALEMVDRLTFISEKDREEAKYHLQLHANVILWQDEDAGGLPIALSDKLRDTAFFKVSMDGVGEVPPVTTEARGTAYCMFEKRTKEFTWFLEFEGLSAAQTQSHFHVGKGGKLGEVVISIPAGSPGSGAQVLGDELVEALFAGNIYLNIHSSSYPLGEIRGQVIPTAVSRSNSGAHPFGDDEEEEKKDDKKNKKKDDKKKTKKGKAEQIKPPAEAKPKAQTPSLEKQGDKGAIYSKEDENKTDAEQITPPKETKPKPEIRNTEKQGEKGAIYSGLDKEPTLPAGTQVRPGILEALKVSGEDIFPDGQLQPPKEKTPKPQVRTMDKQGDKGAVYSAEAQETGIAPKPPTIPAGTPVRPGILEALKVPGQDIFPAGQLQAPKESKPKAQTPKLEKKGEKGAVFSKKKDAAKSEQVKPPAEAKPKAQIMKLEKKGDKGAVYSKDKGKGSRTDFAQPLINVDTRPETQDISQENAKNIRENGNASGAPNSPKAFAKDSTAVLEAIDKLPDSAFAAIERGGKKDAKGNTTPRNLRHLPFKNAKGSIDLPRLRNALVQMNQIVSNSEKDSTNRIRRAARVRLVQAAKQSLPTSKFASSTGTVRLSEIIGEFDIMLCISFFGGKFEVAKAQLMDVIEENSVKLFRLVMGDKDFPINFFVRVVMDGDGNARDIIFDFDTHLSAEVIPDFSKFLRSLKVKKKDKE